jgi:hypothetical protein
VPVINPGEEAVIVVSASEVSFYVRPGAQEVIPRTITVSNQGTPGTTASVTVDTSNVPSYFSVAPSATFLLAAGDSTSVEILLDASLVPPDEIMELQSVGDLLMSAEGVAGSGAQVDVKVALEPYGSGDGICGVPPRNAGGGSGTALAAALLTLVLPRALRGRRRRRPRGGSPVPPQDSVGVVPERLTSRAASWNT